MVLDVLSVCCTFGAYGKGRAFGKAGQKRKMDESTELLMEKSIMGKLEKLNHKMKRQLAREFQGGSPLSCVQSVSLHYIMTESRNGDVFTKDLEEFLDIKSSSATSLVNYLEKFGYIRREPLEEDGRYRRLVLTHKAWEIEPQLNETVENHIKGKFAGFTGEELRNLERLIDKMLANTSG